MRSLNDAFYRNIKQLTVKLIKMCPKYITCRPAGDPRKTSWGPPVDQLGTAGRPTTEDIVVCML